jgi:hypothetical protein
MSAKYTGRNATRISGFASQNSGEIHDCYSIVKLKKNKGLIGGFAGENIGGITHSFYSNKITRLHGGVYGTGRGKSKESFFFHNEREDSKRLDRLHDAYSGVRRERIKSDEDAEKLGFDTINTWEYVQNQQVLRFIPEKWIFDVKKSDLYPTYANSSPVGDDHSPREVTSRMRIPSGTKINARVISDAGEMFKLAKTRADDHSSIFIHLDLNGISTTKVAPGIIRTTDELMALFSDIQPDNCVFAPGFIHLDFARQANDVKLAARIISQKNEILDFTQRISNETGESAKNNIALSYIRIELDSVPADFDEKVKVSVISGAAGVSDIIKRVKRGESGHTLIQINVDSTKTEISFTENAAFIPIRTADELFSLAHAINTGNRALSGAYIRLENDLDLSGQEWTPIGCELTKAFTGLFDGGGYTVKNFVIKEKSEKAKGFFGYLKGEVYNLTVDCYIKSADGVTAGGIAAFCEKGVIGYCAAIIDIKCKNSIGGALNCGGLVGSNSGRIIHSYAAGIIGVVVVPWWLGTPVPLLILLLFLALPGIFEPGEPDPAIRVFPPPPHDPGIVRTPGDPINPSPTTDYNITAFEFRNEIWMNPLTGELRFNFRNPGHTNHDIMIQLLMPDGVVLAGSGAVPPGYSLQNLHVSDLPDGYDLVPGKYNATVHLHLFDIFTHSLAMVAPKLDVSLVVVSG